VQTISLGGGLFLESVTCRVWNLCGFNFQLDISFMVLSVAFVMYLISEFMLH